MLLMVVIGWLAQRRVKNVDDYVLAGRRLPLSLTSVTMIATWFGAESLMTTTDTVAHQGISGAMLDPVGISLCLLITGLFVAGPMWRTGLLTIPDFFRDRYGKLSEVLSSIVLVPSYFGWIAAQYVALATILSQLYGWDVNRWIIIVAIAGTSYSLMGGMLSITWTDTIQLILIIIGLALLGCEVLETLGSGSLSAGLGRIQSEAPDGHWRLANPGTFSRDLLVVFSALTIGSLGNLPVQDLMQRVFSAKSSRVASASCYVAAVGYLAMGLLPMGVGLAANLLLDDVPEEGVLTEIAHRLLSGPSLIIFLLAVVSAVLSTIVSAVMAPASVLAHNLLEPIVAARTAGGQLSHQQALLLQRGSVIAVAAASVLLALSDRGAYELVQDSYAMSLVGMFVPFVVGIYKKSAPALAANSSLVVGIASWFLHTVMGWESFAQPLFGDRFPVPHELVDTILSAVAFAASATFIRCHPARR